MASWISCLVVETQYILWESSFISSTIRKVLGHGDELLKQKHKLNVELRSLLSSVKAIDDELLPYVGGIKYDNPDVRDWLRKLKYVMYDAEDLLELNMVELASRKRKLDDTSADEDMKNIRVKLDEITMQGKGLGLQSTSQVSSSIRKERDSVSLFGRDVLASKIIDMLVPPTSNSDGHQIERELSILPIVGVPGVGKTALVKFVFDEEKVKRHFKLRLWICVGMFKDWEEKEDALFQYTHNRRITLNIINEIDGSERENYWMGLDSLQIVLEEKMKDKRPFLLVVDDALKTERCSWNRLLEPLRAVGGGSWVIVTTSENRVADAIWDKRDLINVGCLDENDMWSIFTDHAFGGEDNNDHPTLESIGRKIIPRLQGLPLAAEMIGRILHGNKDESSWRKILDSPSLSGTGQDTNDRMLPIIRRYGNLPTHLKQCFSYLALFPEDCIFPCDNSNWFFYPINHIADQWMAQRFVECKEPKNPRDVGNGCVIELLNRSLLQYMNDDVVMHDLGHELVDLISTEEIFRVSGDTLEQPTAPENVYLRYSHRAFLELQDYSRLPTLLFREQYGLAEMSNLFDMRHEGLRTLRVLSLEGDDITSLPDSIGNFQLLRYLSLSLPKIKQLPETISCLQNLQVLRLRDCSGLGELPNSMTRLVNLKYLDATGTLLTNINNIGVLTNLQWLNAFHVEKQQRGSNIVQLKNLNQLTDSLDISGMENIESREEAQQAQLHKKKDLTKLKLTWGISINDASISAMNQADVLEGLRPSDNLKRLSIILYSGISLPGWLSSQTSTNLRFLEISDCPNIRSIPMRVLCQLKVIECLSIEKCKSLYELDFHVLISLKVLVIKACPELVLSQKQSSMCKLLQEVRIWDFSPSQLAGLFCILKHSSPRAIFLDFCLFTSNESTGSRLEDYETFRDLYIDRNLPSLDGLQNLYLYGCEGTMYLSQIHSLKRLTIENCSMLPPPGEAPLFPSLTELKLTDIPYEDLSHFIRGSRSSPFKRLIIFYCVELECFVDELEEAFLSFTSLEELHIIGCSNLISLPNDFRGFQYLRLLRIYQCSELSSLPENLPDSINLDIWGCPKLKEASKQASGNKPTSLIKAPSKKDGLLLVHRCFVEHYVKTMESLRLTEAHNKIMSKTPFANFLNMSRFPIDVALIQEIITGYEGNNTFQVREKKIKFTIEDVGAILGLPSTGHKVQIRGRVKDSLTEKELFGSEKCNLSRNVLKDKLDNLIHRQDAVGIIYCCKVLILYMLACFLLPNSGYSCPRQVMTCLDDLNKLHYYNWSEAVHSTLMSNIQQIASDLSGRRRPSKCAIGCLLCMQVWAHEHFNIKQPTYPNESPLFKRWQKVKSQDHLPTNDYDEFAIANNDQTLRNPLGMLPCDHYSPDHRRILEVENNGEETALPIELPAYSHLEGENIDFTGNEFMNHVPYQEQVYIPQQDNYILEGSSVGTTEITKMLASMQDELNATKNELKATQNELSTTQHELKTTRTELSSTIEELGQTKDRLSEVEAMMKQLGKIFMKETLK